MKKAAGMMKTFLTTPLLKTAASKSYKMDYSQEKQQVFLNTVKC
jgi:hypothetical protein